jgi:hypothetical protein
MKRCSDGLRLWINPVQRPVYRELGKHDDLLDRQRRTALRTTELISQITGHDIG